MADCLTMKANQTVRRVGSMLVIRQNRATPSAAEWSDFLRILRQCRSELPSLKILIVTDGGGPDTSQRKQLQEALGGSPVRVAVVSDSIKVRFVASTIMLFHEDHRAFSMSEIKGAYDHLNMTPVERSQAEAALKEMSIVVVT